MRQILGRPVSSLARDRLLDAVGVDRYIHEIGKESRFWWSTDDNLRLEYRTPKANVNDGEESQKRNMNILSRFGER